MATLRIARPGCTHVTVECGSKVARRVERIARATQRDARIVDTFRAWSADGMSQYDRALRDGAVTIGQLRIAGSHHSVLVVI